MNTQEDSRDTSAVEAQNVHPALEASKPGEIDPQVAPIGIKPEFECFSFPNALDRSSEQRLIDYNQEYERAVAFYYATGDASDAADAGTPERERAEVANGHAVRILKEIESNAYAVPARTVREVALKARIMSNAKGEWWDHTLSEVDADARLIIEDVLALAGLDRIKRPDFSFADLLPGYAGPARVDPVTPTHDVGETPGTPPLSLVHALGLEAQSLWDLYSRIDSRKTVDKAHPTLLENDMNAVRHRISCIEDQVSYMQPVTLADVMVQLVLIIDAVDSLESDNSKVTDAIDRMAAASLSALSGISGLSFEQAGVTAYSKQMIRLNTKSLLERYDPGRLDRYEEQPVEQAAA